MPNLKIKGGPRDGGEYKMGDGYKEEFGDIRLAYKKEDGSTGIALYRRDIKRTHYGVSTPSNILEFVRNVS